MPDLARLREQEFRAATEVLRIEVAAICHHPDGGLAHVTLEELGSILDDHADGVELVLVVDEDGITGHPDHRRATEAAVAWARDRGVPVLGVDGARGGCGQTQPRVRCWFHGPSPRLDRHRVAC